VDGISLLGLDQYGADPFILDALLTWNSNFEQFAAQPAASASASASAASPPRQRIFTTSYRLAENIDRQLEGGRQAEMSSPSAALKARVGSGAEAVAHFSLLDARLDISAMAMADDASLDSHDMAEAIR
jgi:hypothetical protein